MNRPDLFSYIPPPLPSPARGEAFDGESYDLKQDYVRLAGQLLDEKYFDIACKRIQAALDAPDMFIEPPKPAKQEAML